MRLTKRFGRALGVTSLLILSAAGCGDLDVENPNAPDRDRALSDPDGVEAVAAGAFRTWFNAYTSLRGAGVLATQARSYSSSWNNGNLNFHSSVDNPTAPPADWVRMGRFYQNDPSAAARTTIDAFWGGGLDESALARGGIYNSLSAANDALGAIRNNGMVIRTEGDTRRVEAISLLMQGASLMMLSLQYDKAYIVDENTDLAGLEYSLRNVVRDSAVSKLEQAADVASANSFTTPAQWTNGFAYTNVEIAKIAHTMAAMAIGFYPRDNSEMAAVDWAAVASHASQGMSSGGSDVNFWFVQDGYNAWISELMNWFDGIDSGRIHTRVAHLLDPATQIDPWPAAGNARPNSPDRRLGDGSFGNAETEESFDVPAKTANAGTDFVWSATGQVFRPDRGQYHQSNIGQVRYDASGVMDAQGQYGGYGPAPAINASVNDLLWAQALIKQGGAANIAQAVTLINKTRVTRGGLSSAATFAANVGNEADGPCMSNGLKAKDGTACSLYSVLLYEWEVEMPGVGPVIYWVQRQLPVITGGGFPGDNSPRRVIAGLLPGTPREMPVPYKELGITGEPLYTWGGSTPNSPAP
jgi:hypothetical protein